VFLLKQNTRASAGVENVEAATVSVTAAVARRSFFILALGRLLLVTGLPSFTGMTNFTAAVTRVIGNNRLGQPPNEVCASPNFWTHFLDKRCDCATCAGSASDGRRPRPVGGLVCRQSILDSWLGNLRECLAHLV